MKVRIDRIGARGDGIADEGDEPVYVPLTAPGDVVEIALGARRGDGRSAILVDLLEAGPARIDPACPHFGVCGGCVLQHLEGNVYLDWKRDRVREALARVRIETDIAPTISVPPGTRRRVRLAFRKVAAGMLLGFRAAGSDRIVDVSACPIACGDIVSLLPRLRGFLARHANRGEVAVTLSDTGFDLLVSADTPIALDLQLDAPEFCETANVARLSWAAGKQPPEPLLDLRPARVSFGGIGVDLPADAFLQPTKEGEAVLTGFVLTAAGSARHIADLYAGCGAFALPLAAAGKVVHAVDNLALQTRALLRANPNVSQETRDLARQPLRPDELTRFAAVVLDPPRAGAAPQIAEIAASAVPKVIYVSCNPATFARDARVLVDAGFRLERVQPVDQFLWSAHVELASVFRRP